MFLDFAMDPKTYYSSCLSYFIVYLVSSCPLGCPAVFNIFQLKTFLLVLMHISCLIPSVRFSTTPNVLDHLVGSIFYASVLAF